MKSFYMLFLALLTALQLVSAQATNGTEDLQTRFRVFPQVKVSKTELNAFAKNPANKPKMDFTPTGTVPQPKSAGVSKPKKSKQIIGGSAAVLTQFPWQIYLIADSAWLCGGSLIAADWVMTAAHCVYGAKSIVVTIGGIDRIKNETYEKSQTSTTFTHHENFNNIWLVNDIAVIKMPNPFVLNDYVNVVLLPTQADASKTFDGQAVTASGYGMTSNNGSPSTILMFVDLKVLPLIDCVATFGTNTVQSTTICTAAELKKSICSGDSGGPLMTKVDTTRFKQIGIVSFAARSCTKNPNGYTRVSSFLGWLSSKTGIAIA